MIQDSLPEREPPGVKVDPPRPCVLLFENNHVLASLLLEMLETEQAWETVGVNGTFDAGRSQMLKAKPDVIILDWDLPDVCRLEALRGTVEQLPASHVIILNDEDEQQSRYIEAALENGAEVCMSMNSPATDLVPAVKDILKCHSIPK